MSVREIFPRRSVRNRASIVGHTLHSAGNSVNRFICRTSFRRVLFAPQLAHGQHGSTVVGPSTIRGMCEFVNLWDRVIL